MPSCAATGCNNNSNKGCLLKLFPKKDKHRRQVWIDRVNRPGWQPSRYSALCSRHFDHNQWEISLQNGRKGRKLKKTAVPTIFCVGCPKEDDLVSLDHAYCIEGYRQTFDYKSDFNKTDDEECPDTNIIPIEHIKVEVDENENFAPEVAEEQKSPADKQLYESDEERPRVEDLGSTNVLVKEEPIEEENGIEKGDGYYSMEKEEARIEEQNGCVLWLRNEEVNEDEAEDIQCTPDIAIFTENEEPDPIEEVVCEMNELNASMSDPSVDPLALSAEDVVRADKVVPNFVNRRRLMFIPKDKKAIPCMPRIVEGEPNIQENSTNQKILNPQHLSLPKPPTLFDPSKFRTYLDVPMLESSPPMLTPIPKILTLQTSAKLISLQPSDKLTLNLFKPQPLLQQNGNYLATEVNESLSKKDREIPFFKKFVTTPTTVPAPDYLRPGTQLLGENNIVTLNYHLPGLKPMSKTVRVKKNKKLILSPQKLDPIKNVNLGESKVLFTKNGRKLVISSVRKCALAENIFLEHQYTQKPKWKPYTMDGVKFKKELSEPNISDEKVVTNTQIGNNQVKMWMNNNKVDVAESYGVQSEDSSSTSPIRIKLSGILPKITTSSTSSVVVLKPYETLSNPLTGGNPFIQKQRKVDLFQCTICKLLFLTVATLKMHKRTHTRPKNISLKNKLQKEQIAEDSDYENVKTSTKLHKKTIRKRSKSENYKDKRRKNLRKVNRACDGFENGFVFIPNLNFKTKSSDDEFLRLSKLVSSVEDDNLPVKINETLDINSKTRKIAHERLEESSDSQDSEKTLSSEECKGLGVDNSGRRYSLRAKTKTYKSRLLSATKRKYRKCKSKSIVHSVLKKNPVVLVPELELNVSQCCNESDEKQRSRTKKYKKLHPPYLEDSTLDSEEKKETEDSGSISTEDTPKDKSLAKETIKNFENTDGEVEKNNSETLKIKCPTCQLMIRRSLMRVHLNLHISSDYICKLCGKKFGKSFQLRRHTIIEHKVVKRFHCQRRDCNKSFETKRELTKHSRVHTNLRLK